MNFKKYLQRININHSPSPTLEDLFLLQKNHLLNVPFENLDIHLGRKIELNTKKIFHKIVNENRGGFCYELNGLFFFLLENIGFEVKRINAQVFGSKKVFGKPYDHMAILVKVNRETYLVDVGFGKFAFQPLKIELDKVQTDGNDFFMIKKLNHRYHVVMTQSEDKNWRYGYKFTKKHREVDEFLPMCIYHQTSPNTNFTKRKMITIPTTQNGRITLTSEVLKITTGEKLIEKPIKSELDFNKKLKKYFNLQF